MPEVRYEFGLLIIGNRKYHRDLIILPSGEIRDWWRREGHEVHREDLEEFLSEGVRKVLIGTGYYGRLKISRDLEEFLREKGIELEFGKTEQIVKRLGEEKALFALHLTC